MSEPAYMTDAERAAMEAAWTVHGGAHYSGLIIEIWLAAKAHYTSQARPPKLGPITLHKRNCSMVTIGDTAECDCGDGRQTYPAAPASAPAPAYEVTQAGHDLLTAALHRSGKRVGPTAAGSGAALDDAYGGETRVYQREAVRIVLAERDILRARVAELEQERADVLNAAGRIVGDTADSAGSTIDALAAQVERLTKVIREYVAAKELHTHVASDPQSKTKQFIASRDAMFAAYAALARSTPDAAGAGEGR